MGFEIELMAPVGRTRLDLAQATARRIGGSVQRFFHPQSEVRAAPGQAVFDNLTPGFRVRDADGAWHADFVDDLTLQGGLDREAAPRPGWGRIVADDARLLRLVMRHCDPDAAAETMLDPLAALFGTEPQRHPSGMVRVVDDRGHSVAVGAPLPGQRDRPCEIVTAPLAADHREVLGSLLADARDLGFALPLEGATHVHFDAGPLCSAPDLRRLVRLYGRHGPALRRLVGVNPACVRLGPWPPELEARVEADDFPGLDWEAARAALRAVPLSKYCDLNLINLLAGRDDKHTVEVRILPASLDAGEILDGAALFEALLRGCVEAGDEPVPETLMQVLLQASMEETVRTRWLKRVRSEPRAFAQRRSPVERNGEAIFASGEDR
ncbi:amidoligase family protein [Brevundimonas aurifodinae]